MKRVEVFPKNKSYTLEDVKAWVDKAVQDGGWLILMTHAWYTTFDAAQLKELVGYIRASGAELMDLYDALDATGNVVEAGDYQKPGADAAEPFLWWMRMAAPGPTRWRTYARQMASPMWGQPCKVDM